LGEWGLVSRYRENLRALMNAEFRDTTAKLRLPPIATMVLPVNGDILFF
jgi:hypothetical protein